jgi:hypothetical protein
MPVGRFSPTDNPKQVLLTPQKSFIGKFPTVWIHLSKTLFENREQYTVRLSPKGKKQKDANHTNKKNNIQKG